MKLLADGPQAMADYFQEDDVNEFDGKFFVVVRYRIRHWVSS